MGEQELQLAESLVDKFRDELFAIPSEIETQVTQPLDTALRQAADVHHTLITRLEAECEAGHHIAPLELERYRAAAVTDVSEFLVDTIRKIDAGSAVGSVFVDSIQRLQRIMTDGPEETGTPVGSDVHAQRQNTSRLRQLRRGWHRLVRRLRSWRDAAPLERQASLRQIREFDLVQQITEELLPVYEVVQQSISRRFASIERHITEWSFAVLELHDDFGLDDLVTLHSDEAGLDSVAGSPGDSEKTQAPNLEVVTDAMDRLVLQNGEPLVESIRTPLEEVLSGIAAELPSVLEAASTPILRSARRVLPLVDDPEPVAWKKCRERWERWHVQVSHRLRLNHAVLAFREQLTQQAARMLCETRDVAVEPVLSALESAQIWLDSSRPRLEGAFDAEATGDSERLVDIIEAVDREAERELQRLFQDSILRDAQTALTDPGATRWLELSNLVGQLPNDLVIHSHSYVQDTAVDPGIQSFSVDLRAIATSALAPDWPTLLSEAAEPLKAGITRSFVGAEKLQNVIDFNLSAAVNELVEPSEPDAKAAAAPDDGETTSGSTPVETARELATDALRRSGELIDDLRDSLDEPWSEFARAFDLAVSEDWHDLISQVKSDDMMSERWIGMRTRALRHLERFKDRGLLLWEKTLARTRQKTGALRRLAARLIRRGRTAVGLDDATEQDEFTIADGLRSVENEQKNLPLVYRRLFSLGGVAEPSLLQGRGRDLVNVRQKFEKWKSGHGVGVIVLTGRIGSGRTSFLEALREKVFDGCKVHVLDVEERSTAAERLVEALAEQLRVSGESRSWTGVEAELLRRNDSEEPIVFLLDNLENLMLQAPGGTDLLQDLLAFFVRTEHAVFWLATISVEAWKYFEKVAGMSAASVGSQTLATIGRKEAEDVVAGRHHSSGMTLRFEPPADPSPLLKRRLRRADKVERAQEILQEVYFDALFKHTNGTIGLSLLYWLRSVEFEDDDDVVAVRPLKPLVFDQLAKLDLPRLFSLKAFVVHNTLTACELATILRVPVDRSRLILSALLRLAVIERVQPAGTESNEPADCANERFRLNRLVVHPVVERLRGARILY